MSDKTSWNEHLQQITSNSSNTTQDSSPRTNERPNFTSQIEQRGNNARFGSEPVIKGFDSHIEFSTKHDD